MSTFIRIAKYRTLMEAQLALGRLEAEGIPAHLTDTYLAQALPGTIIDIHLLVPPGSESTARRVLETDYSDQLDEDDETT